MRDFLKSSGRQLRAGWFWPLVLLALPNCTNDFRPFEVRDPAFEPGPNPTSAVMCDIPKVQDHAIDNCATPMEIMSLMSMEHAAVAQAQGEPNTTLALDFSADAIAMCGGPRKVEFLSPFPAGITVCVNCGTQIGGGKKFPDANAVCVAMCIDLTSLDGGPQAFCQSNAHVSTNFDKNGNTCYINACTSGGNPDGNFHDPRQDQDNVNWQEQNGTGGANGSSGNNLSRTAGRSGNFDAGGFSKQVIQHGEAWVEFQVSDNTKAYAVGFSSSPADHETLEDIPFALVLNANGTLSISQGGNITGNFGSYSAGDRFRVHVMPDTSEPTKATLSATRLDPTQPPCMGQFTNGMTCVEIPIATASSVSPYPFQVDASLIDTGPEAILENVTMVFIEGAPK